MPFVVKWIPKDQDVTIDHSTRYDDPSDAINFACNILKLDPKKVWIEDHHGNIYAEHDKILEHAANRISRSR